MEPLYTKRLKLRNVEEDDIHTIVEYRNHEVTIKYQRNQIRDMEGIKQLIQDSKEDSLSMEKTSYLSIAFKTTNEMIGEIMVMPNKQDQCISLGYTLSHAYHRQGYGFEALSVLIDYLHEKYPSYSFVSFADPNNIASIHLLKKLGYHYLGYSSKLVSEVFGKWLSDDIDVFRSKKED
ncbi:MAG: GNAT family N-acetyltransferase [Erysipelotrichaceae bacterium]